MQASHKIANIESMEADFISFPFYSVIELSNSNSIYSKVEVNNWGNPSVNVIKCE